MLSHSVLITVLQQLKPAGRYQLYVPRATESVCLFSVNGPAVWNSLPIDLRSLDISAVTETVPEPETAVFRQNRGEPKQRFFGAK